MSGSSNGGPSRKRPGGKGSRVREGGTPGPRQVWAWDAPGVLIVLRASGQPIMPITPCDSVQDAQEFIAELCADGVYTLGELAVVAFERIAIEIGLPAEPATVGRSAAKPLTPLH